MTIADSGAPADTVTAATTQTGTPDGNSDGTPGTAGGGIDRLHPFDGLFLRAEHLDQIQDYAREFGAAVGRSGGPGVVEGFQVFIERGELQVGAGLAIDSAGRPLRSGRQVSLPLKTLKPENDTFWWVVVSRANWNYGDTAVQGLLCEDPCAGGTTNKQFTAEGVRIDLVPDTLPGLGAAKDSARRNLLASWLFGQEQKSDTPWLATPAALPADWEPPVVYGRPPVRLAVLIPIGNNPAQWVVDAWSARREVGAPPPERWWQGRLGMRPWNVFVAQILQFQAQLAEWRGDPAGAAVASAAAEEELAHTRAELMEIVEKAANTRSQVALAMKAKVEEAIENVGRRIADAQAAQALPQPPLAERGFGDLPPAGYLPVQVSSGGSAAAASGLHQEVVRLLGQQLNLRFCHGTPADIAAAVQQAQHRGRITLQSAADVDILVPVADFAGSGDLAATDGWTGGWVAFVRQNQLSCSSGR
ncbi:hypothetical protein [Streptomyces sp. NRRL WC-3742]|uniref:hypothetical protein n=1 Tax=Streptomyces sp. NRRL WC-3742 TaxID=1463934 RepID=UPI0004C82E82|nr:hypothetical protein [Streptomyces sp. NRRL WC-3742]